MCAMCGRLPLRVVAGFGLRCAVALGWLATPAFAQQQPPGGDDTVTLVGVVVDGATRIGVGGAFLSLGERGPRAITDSAGGFRLANVPIGEHTLTVQRYGYVELELPVTVRASPEPFVLSLVPDPLVLEGLTVTGGARVALSGVVVDASTGDPLPWVSLWLSRDAVQREGSAASDPQGLFRIPDVPTGAYFLRVQEVGYVSQYLMVTVSAPPQPLEVRLEPDSAVMAGLGEWVSRLRGRRNYAQGINLAYDRERLNYSAAPDVRHFLEWETSIFMVRCGQGISGYCVSGRQGRLVEPRVYIDELPIIGGLDVLATYRPHELYLIEVFNRGATIRAYTPEFMSRMAIRPRALLPDLR